MPEKQVFEFRLVFLSIISRSHWKSYRVVMLKSTEIVNLILINISPESINWQS